MSSFFSSKKKDKAASGDSAAKAEKEESKSSSSSSSQKSGSPMFRAKKYMASRMTESSSGRSTIIGLFGHSGDALMQAINSTVEHVEGKEFAKNVEIDILKLSAKIGLLHSDGILTNEKLQVVSAPSWEIVIFLVHNLEAKNPKHIQNAPIVAAMSEVHKEMMKLITDHMQPKNSSRLTNVCQFLGSDKYLDQLFTSPALAAERMTILTHVNRLMNPYANQMEEMNKFLREQTKKKRDKLHAMVGHPQLTNFLKFQNTRKLVMEWIDESQDKLTANRSEFLVAVDDFKDITSRPLMKARAAHVFDKFLHPGSGKFVAVLSEPETTDLEENVGNLETVRKSMFDHACARVCAALDPLFERHFLTSAQFQALVDELESLDVRLHVDSADHEAEHEGDTGGGAATEKEKGK